MLFSLLSNFAPLVAFEFTRNISHVSEELVAMSKANSENNLYVYRLYMGDVKHFNCLEPQIDKFPKKSDLPANMIVVNICEFHQQYAPIEDVKAKYCTAQGQQK